MQALGLPQYHKLRKMSFCSEHANSIGSQHVFHEVDLQKSR
jgi:hypothetical protein